MRTTRSMPTTFPYQYAVLSAGILQSATSSVQQKWAKPSNGRVSTVPMVP